MTLGDGSEFKFIPKLEYRLALWRVVEFMYDPS